MGQVSIIPFNDTWKYLDDGSDQGSVWQSNSFDDGAWKIGSGKFGFGINDANTIISYGPSDKKKYITTYFRKVIHISDPDIAASFLSYLKCDDGAIVYVNETEAFRINMPHKKVNFKTKASREANDIGNSGQLIKLDNSLFVPGVNVIAVEIHQEKDNKDETDMAFDFSLSVVDDIPPVVVSINRLIPAVAFSNMNSVTFRCVFSEIVSGVDIADFITKTVTGNVTGSITALNPVGIDGTTFDITISSISGDGVLRLDLNSIGTGIMDIAGNVLLNGFHMGQVYAFNEVPVSVDIKRRDPIIEHTTSDEVIFRVVFSTPVRGVDATDFIATSLSGNVRGSLEDLSVEPIDKSGTPAVVPVGQQGTTYDVSVRAISGNGTIRLDIKNDNTGIENSVGVPFVGGYEGGQTYNIQAPLGFSFFKDINPLSISSHTAEKPQAKIWYHANKWWSVLSTSTGTKIFRLDGDSWTETLKIAGSGNAKADCIVVGNVTHILLYRGTSNSFLCSVEYDASKNEYIPWTRRPVNTTAIFEFGSQTATLAMDGKGRMWMANDGENEIYIRWSDAPYDSWSEPITVVTGINDDDMCAIISLKGKIGVMWSDQNSRLFGFKTHIDGTNPVSWSTDESPGSKSALNIGKGFADNHICLTTGNDGTLYAVIKTGYDTPGELKLGLLVRSSSGKWEKKPYPVTANEGTRPIVILNEAAQKLKVVYTTHEKGGDILYRETPINKISFGRPKTLMGGNPSIRYNYSSSSHMPYNSDVVVISTNITGGSGTLKAVGVIGSDLPFDVNSYSPVLMPVPPNTEIKTTLNQLNLFPNPAIKNARLSFTVTDRTEFSVILYNSTGTKMGLIKNGTAINGILNTINIDVSNLKPGIYLVQLITKTGTRTVKLSKPN